MSAWGNHWPAVFAAAFCRRHTAVAAARVKTPRSLCTSRNLGNVLLFLSIIGDGFVHLSILTLRTVAPCPSHTTRPQRGNWKIDRKLHLRFSLLNRRGSSLWLHACSQLLNVVRRCNYFITNLLPRRITHFKLINTLHTTLQIRLK